MLPLRLVIDTNVLISAAIKPAGLQRTVLLLAITKPARLYVSRPILEEYSEVLARPELRIRKGPKLIEDLIVRLRAPNIPGEESNSLVPPPPSPMARCESRKDTLLRCWCMTRESCK